MPAGLPGPESDGGAGPEAAWDVIIVGAGPAGSAAAMVLSGFGRRVLLLDRSVAHGFKLGESIAPGALGLVRHFLGEPESFPGDLAFFRTAGNLSVWADAAPQTTDFFFTPAGHGLCVDRVAFDEALRRRAARMGATLLTGARFVSCARAADGSADWLATVAVAGGQRRCRARFLLDCSGRQAAVGRALGVGHARLDRLFAYARWYDSPLADEDRLTRIEAGPQGWWYSNRLHAAGAGSRRLVVFHGDRDTPAARDAASAAGFDRLLRDSVLLGPLLRDRAYAARGPVRGAPAHSQRLDAFCGEGWLAAGDAAQAYDPLSSQGIWKALDTGSQAGHAAHDLLQEGREDGGRAADERARQLRQYAQRQARAWETYRTQLGFYYASQPRWRDAPFWRRRRDAAAWDPVRADTMTPV
ncbi:NAD(P)/FAD-dependent oxidoreductase [Castellaniella defragrans]|uniref:Flavin-dependent dehydrogenase n=1 Tax=Castellaniella defragrans TaxID=75697 RepID=A0A7W9TQB9_CASDE|nr:tryptophan 7-halogenase [Castellaniella defragrans]KAB0622173.1 FAD-dependent oxidoreductase [Castellaniella defragrans]MBB6084596.1 flavin-dependent dehydrogenase [Castellaniella defragrans]